MPREWLTLRQYAATWLPEAVARAGLLRAGEPLRADRAAILRERQRRGEIEIEAYDTASGKTVSPGPDEWLGANFEESWLIQQPMAGQKFLDVRVRIVDPGLPPVPQMGRDRQIRLFLKRAVWNHAGNPDWNPEQLHDAALAAYPDATPLKAIISRRNRELDRAAVIGPRPRRGRPSG